MASPRASVTWRVSCARAATTSLSSPRIQPRRRGKGFRSWPARRCRCGSSRPGCRPRGCAMRSNSSLPMSSTRPPPSSWEPVPCTGPTARRSRPSPSTRRTCPATWPVMRPVRSVRAPRTPPGAGSGERTRTRTALWLPRTAASRSCGSTGCPGPTCGDALSTSNDSTRRGERTQERWNSVELLPPAGRCSSAMWAGSPPKRSSGAWPRWPPSRGRDWCSSATDRLARTSGRC